MKFIIDVSSVVYGGHNGSNVRVRGFPVGGIRKLFGIINANLGMGDIVLCFDGGEIIKKELLPTYKAGRVPDYSVLAQIDLIKEMCLECNIPYYWDPKYEADDFVFSVCNEFVFLGDTDLVVIYTDDRDMACCVTDKISIRNVTSNGICIDKPNYPERVVRERDIPYNTILLWKVFHGDSSDSYRALHIPGLNFDVFSERFLETVTPYIDNGSLTEFAYTMYDVFCVVADSFSDSVSSEDLEKLKTQGRIAFPYQVPVSDTDREGYITGLREGKQRYELVREHMKVFHSDSINTKRFNFYCSMLGLNKLHPGRYVDKDSVEAQEFYSLLDLKAKELSNGTMAVERYRNRRTIPQHTDTLGNMDLPL